MIVADKGYVADQRSATMGILISAQREKGTWLPYKLNLKLHNIYMNKIPKEYGKYCTVDAARLVPSQSKSRPRTSAYARPEQGRTASRTKRA
jgi:hypothetical protein